VIVAVTVTVAMTVTVAVTMTVAVTVTVAVITTIIQKKKGISSKSRRLPWYIQHNQSKDPQQGWLIALLHTMEKPKKDIPQGIVIFEQSFLFVFLWKLNSPRHEKAQILSSYSIESPTPAM
jgi:amino acid transporter